MGPRCHETIQARLRCLFIRTEAADVRPPWVKADEPYLCGKSESIIKQGFGWGKGGDHANSSNPFHNCKGFTFNVCTFEDCDEKR